MRDELVGIVADHVADLGSIAWPSEADRWAELVFCLLNAYADGDAAAARLAVGSLHELRLLEPAVLASCADGSSKAADVAAFALSQYGFTEANASAAVAVLASVAKAVVDKYDGKLQRFMRAKGLEIRDELVAGFAPPKDQSAQVTRAVTHWLQNGFAFPLISDEPHVAAFARSRRIGVDDVEQAADELDLNLTLVDDVIRLENAGRQLKSSK